MLGKPSRVKPVFIWDSAGPCVLVLAVIEWMKHMSSASSARLRQQVGEVFAALAARFEGVGAFRQVAVGPLEGDELLGARHRLAVALDQFRLVVPGVEMAARPGAEDMQDPLGLGREVRLAGRPAAPRAGFSAATAPARRRPPVRPAAIEGRCRRVRCRGGRGSRDGRAARGRPRKERAGSWDGSGRRVIGVRGRFILVDGKPRRG